MDATDDGFGDFGDFENAQQDDGFGDFGEFQEETQKDDGFGDFGDFTEAKDEKKVAPNFENLVTKKEVEEDPFSSVFNSV